MATCKDEIGIGLRKKLKLQRKVYSHWKNDDLLGQKEVSALIVGLWRVSSAAFNLVFTVQ